MVSADEIRSMFPQLRSDDIVGGSFCSTDGFVDPYSAMVGFMARAADHGARCGETEVRLFRATVGHHRRRDHARAGVHADGR